MDIMGFVKQHPVPVGIGFVVLLVVVSASRNSGGSAGSKTAAAAAYATAANAQNAQVMAINSATAQALGAQSVEKFKASESAAVQRQGLATSALTSLAGVSAAIGASSNQTLTQTLQIATAGQVSKDQIAADLEKQTRSINGGIKMNADTLAAQIRLNENDNNFKLAQIGKTTQGNLDLMQMMGSNAVTLAGVNGATALALADKQITQAFGLADRETIQQFGLSDRTIAGQVKLADVLGGYDMGKLKLQLDATERNLPSIMQNAENMAKINGKTATDITYWQHKAGMTTAQAAKNKSDWGIVTDIGGTIAKFFGF